METLAAETSSQAVTLMRAQRTREKWDRLGLMECAARMKMAHALHLEAVLSAALEFPVDDRSLWAAGNALSSPPSD